jgi:hypothetical protein
MASKKLPVLTRAKPTPKPMGKPKGERLSKTDGGPKGEPSSPLNVSPRIRTSRVGKKGTLPVPGGTLTPDPEVEGGAR